MTTSRKYMPARRRIPLPLALLGIVGCCLALAGCASGSGVDKKKAYREAEAQCAGAPDMFVCRRERSGRIIDEGYVSICRAKGIADNSPAMKRCKGELAYADCVRTLSDYQGYAAQMNPRGPWQPSPSETCKHYITAE